MEVVYQWWMYGGKSVIIKINQAFFIINLLSILSTLSNRGLLKTYFNIKTLCSVIEERVFCLDRSLPWISSLKSFEIKSCPLKRSWSSLVQSFQSKLCPFKGSGNSPVQSLNIQLSSLQRPRNSRVQALKVKSGHFQGR